MAPWTATKDPQPVMAMALIGLPVIGAWLRLRLGQPENTGIFQKNRQ